MGTEALTSWNHVRSHPFGAGMNIERYRLDNGLQVLVLEDHRAPVICYQTWLAVGSRHEQPGKTGISHLFEHLMFGGTANRPLGELDRLIETAGADSNAGTYLDWTYYTISAPSEALELVVGLEADRMQHLALAEDFVLSEREVVVNERRQSVDDDVDGAIGELLFKEAFRQHGYRWPTIGFMEDIRGLTVDDCRQFYRTHYAPNSACVVVVGDVDPAQLERLVCECYGAIPSAEIPVEDVRPEPAQQAERRLQIRKPTATAKLVVGYRSPAYGDFDYAALVLLNEILTGGRASRLHRDLVQRLELVSSVRGYVGAFRDPSLYDLWLTAREDGDPATLLEQLDQRLERVCAEPVQPAELDRAKARVELSALQGLETVSGRAGQIGFCETVLGDPAALFARVDAMSRVTRGDVLRVARRYLRPQARTIIEVLPDPAMDRAEEAS